MTSNARRFVRALLAVVVGLGAPCLEGYQSQTKVLDNKQDKAETGPDNLVVHVDLVNVLFTVADRKGKLVGSGKTELEDP